MAKELTFKNGTVTVFTDLGDMINAIANLKIDQTEMKGMVSHTYEKKPKKLLILSMGNEKCTIFYAEDNGKVRYKLRGYGPVEILNRAQLKLFLEYYYTVRDDEFLELALNTFKVGDEVFYRPVYSPVYSKGIISKVEIVVIYYRHICIHMRLDSGKGFYLRELDKDGNFKSDSDNYETIYPSSCKEEIEKKAIERKKKQLESYEKRVAKLKFEIATKKVW